MMVLPVWLFIGFVTFGVFVGAFVTIATLLVLQTRTAQRESD